MTTRFASLRSCGLIVRVPTCGALGKTAFKTLGISSGFVSAKTFPSAPRNEEGVDDFGGGAPEGVCAAPRLENCSIAYQKNWQPKQEHARIEHNADKARNTVMRDLRRLIQKRSVVQDDAVVIDVIGGWIPPMLIGGKSNLSHNKRCRANR